MATRLLPVWCVTVNRRAVFEYASEDDAKADVPYVKAIVGDDAEVRVEAVLR